MVHPDGHVISPADQSPSGPSTLELHSGIVSGRDATPACRIQRDAVTDPRAALISVIAEKMQDGPCVVQFSGGRDSSLILALAVQAARERSSEMPVAVSVRYPDVVSSHESAWQDLVVRHLGVRHEVVEVARGDDEVCGPLGVSQLVRHGPLLPSAVGVSLGRVAGVVGGRPLLTGEGGDEVLGGSRVSLPVAHWRRRRRPSAQSVADMVSALAPRVVRRTLVRRELQAGLAPTWLQQRAHQPVMKALVEDITDTPWDWREARWLTPCSRQWKLGASAMDAIAGSDGFSVHHPLLDPLFITALNQRGGRLGLATRTEAMSILAGDTLPREVLTRSTKATFNEVYAGDRLRAFARSWDGSGVDTALVDIERLRAAWTDSVVPSASLAPLQLALLAAVEKGWEPGKEMTRG